MKSTTIFKYRLVKILILCALFFTQNSFCQKLKLNDQKYFETQGVNVLVFSSEYNGMFFDEKTAAIGIIHHGLRTSTGGAIRLQNTPEQLALIPNLATQFA